MDTSNAPLIEIGRVLRKHVDRATLGQIIEDLKDVPGNKTFRDAIERLPGAVERADRQLERSSAKSGRQPHPHVLQTDSREATTPAPDQRRSESR